MQYLVTIINYILEGFKTVFKYINRTIESFEGTFVIFDKWVDVIVALLKRNTALLTLISVPTSSLSRTRLIRKLVLADFKLNIALLQQKHRFRFEQCKMLTDEGTSRGDKNLLKGVYTHEIARQKLGIIHLMRRPQGASSWRNWVFTSFFLIGTQFRAKSDFRILT